MNLEPRIKDRPATDIEFLIKRWMPVVISIIAAIVAGFWIGTEKWALLIRIGFVAAVCLVAFALQDRGWILIPMFWMASGSIALLPIPFAYRDLAVMLAICAYITHRCMVKTEPIEMRHMILSLLLANLGWMALMWLRKPVGFNVFGSEYVGARFYLNAFIAMAAAWVLIRLVQFEEKWMQRIPFLILAGSLLAPLSSMFASFFPSAKNAMVSLYSEAYLYDANAPGIARFITLCTPGMLVVLLVAAYTKPTHLFHPLRPSLFLLLLGLFAVGLSGFRNSIAASLAYIALSLILRRNWRQFIIASTIGFLLFGTVIFGQGRFYTLPMPIQRSLSFLPGDWSPVATEEGRGSNEVRFTWWKDIIKYRLIKNWWIGDGIGVRAAEMLGAEESARRNFGEGILFYGEYHNGPLNTIHCVGLVGLLLLYTLMSTTIYYAIRTVRQCLNTRWESLALFIAIPTIWNPIHFTLIFGSFQTQLPEIIIQSGFLLLLIRMIRKHPEAIAPSPSDS